MKRTDYPFSLAVMVSLGASLVLGRGQAAPVTFTIDNAQSQITLSGTISAYSGVLSAPISPQGPGSLGTSYSGAINAALGDQFLEFTGASTILAQTNTNGVWQPGPGASPGSAPADYGAQAQATAPYVGLITAYAALRGIVMDLTSPPLAVTNGGFDASVLVFSFSTNSIGSIDFVDDLGDSGSFLLAGSATNAAGAGASLTNAGGAQQLLIPIDTIYVVNSGVLAGTTLQLTGQILATRPLPPPAITSLVLTNHNAVLAVANATLQSEVEGSSDLKTWLPVSATAANPSALILFTAPITVPYEFYRVRRY